MNEFVDIIVIYVVLRAILAFLGAWWHGDGRNDFRRDRLSIVFLMKLLPCLSHCFRSPIVGFYQQWAFVVLHNLDPD